MRTVFVHLRDTTEKEVAAFLQRTYPAQKGPPWIYEVAGEACLYIDLYRDHLKEFEPQGLLNLVQALNGEPVTSVGADVSGRYKGDDQVHAFVTTMLTEYAGVAMDDYSYHCWTLTEIESGYKFEGHRFFDYLGWYLDDDDSQH